MKPRSANGHIHGENVKELTSRDSGADIHGGDLGAGSFGGGSIVILDITLRRLRRSTFATVDDTNTGSSGGTLLASADASDRARGDGDGVLGVCKSSLEAIQGTLGLDVGQVVGDLTANTLKSVDLGSLLVE